LALTVESRQIGLQSPPLDLRRYHVLLIAAPLAVPALRKARDGGDCVEQMLGGSDRLLRAVGPGEDGLDAHRQLRLDHAPLLLRRSGVRLGDLALQVAFAPQRYRLLDRVLDGAHVLGQR
jgi:hypothetical protein